MKKKLTWLLFIYGPFILVLSIPVFDPTALLQQTLIPADVATGTIIYRLRASNPTFDYPLIFTLRNSPTFISIETLNCTRLNSICQANIILKKRLEPNRFYDFIVDVQSRRGESASLNCSFKSTDAITPISSIFPGAPTLLMVSESAKRNSELGAILARGSANKSVGVLLELWGGRKFGLHQKLVNERDALGTLILVEALDYEVQTVHHLTVLANDPFTDLETDTRNIAGWPLLISVLDEQDTPPVFTLAPPTTTLSPTLDIGDVILLIHAEDGDRGSPRPIRYDLLRENNTFASFFNISQDTGELTLIKPLEQLLATTRRPDPILLTVIAEELRTNPQEAPAQSSTAQIALIPPDFRNTTTPTFAANEYNAILDENSPPGTLLEIHQAEIITTPGNVIILEMLNDNNTFEITPKAVNKQSEFQIRVNNGKLLDYETFHSLSCYITGRQVGDGNYSAIARLTLLLNDVNDNSPEFLQEEYSVSVLENSEFGVSVVKVEARDIDREPGNKIKYVSLKGEGSGFFNLDEVTGLITVRDSLGLDAETSPVLRLEVVAADENGRGRTASVPLTITLIDENDQAPQFEKNLYEFILNSDRNQFTSKAVVKATDKDISPPNNEILYELINGMENLAIHPKTGELTIKNIWAENAIVTTTVRAYDGGIPRLSSTCQVRIYPPEGQSRKTAFIVPGRNPDLEKIKKTIQALTGGEVVIQEVRPAEGYEPSGIDYSKEGFSDLAKSSVVIALVTYPRDSQVDLNQIQRILKQETRQEIVTRREEEVVSSGANLLWILLLLIFLLLIIALILIFCCICQGCPLYVPPKRRKITVTEEKLIKEEANKSVQVAEWFGRKEAWSPERLHVENEVESLQRHEMERGSDRFKNLEQRDQYYIREGNADILRLITRAGSENNASNLQRPVTLVEDTGKDILMRRFIEQQQQQVPQDNYKSYVTLPNSLSRVQVDHETLLETSLLQQNLLLRHILLERERERDRDQRLETQSLPAGTQTDAATETHFGYKTRRKVRSDNDASESDEDEIEEATTRRRSYRKRRLRKIKTPIQEESDDVENNKDSAKSEKFVEIKQTRTSELRQKQNAAERTSSVSSHTAQKFARGGGIEKEVLREISASLDRKNSGNSDNNNKKKYFSQDSLEEISPRSGKTVESEKTVRYHSESDLNLLSKAPEKLAQRKNSLKSQGKSGKGKTTPRYMEWYNKNPKKGEETVSRKNASRKSAENLKKTVEVSGTKDGTSEVSKVKKKGPQHPLLQHSEHRFETNYNVRKPEDDTDSGIAVSRLPKAQKKSVFTIAYDDMHSNQLLRTDSRNSPI